MLDERFEALLKRVYLEDFGKEIPSSSLRVARQYWQDYIKPIKPTYKGVFDEEEFEETPYQVPLPGLTNLPGTTNFNDGFWFMEQYVRRSPFDTSNSDVLK